MSRIYYVKRDGTGGIQHLANVDERNTGRWDYAAPHFAHFNTYAEAREYAQRTTGAALTQAQAASVAAWALPEVEPTEAE